MENNQNKKALTRTFSVKYYGEDATESKALSVEYLENNLKLTIHKLANGGEYKYDYKSGNEIYLKEKSAKILARFIKKAIQAKNSENPEFKPLAVSSAANLIEVSLGSHHNCNTDICITIYNNIDPETMKCENYAVFGFRDTKVIVDYNYADGTYDSIPIDSDIHYFMDQLNEFAKAGTSAYAHFNKKEFKFDMDRIISRQLNICDKLGIKQESLNSNKVSWNNPNGLLNSNNSDNVLSEIDIID